MARWLLEAKPKGVLEPLDPTPVVRLAGGLTQRWRTVNGKVHVQVIYPDNRIEWYQLVEEA
ncbi:MAG: hypothetical protein HRJ53_07525 [Acidobacteria bacterium Pan2503]|uniref:Uncharacterized protein n=1 Tax=Candidatus Acidiferrum panamense TaxID=2741543 RepID=A0A7V8NP12_9BACT|nr:hypothetical protein [Candidatus Acidoferrum panamensis]